MSREAMKPVAWTDEDFTELIVSEDIAKDIGATVPLYTAPPKREPEPKPVAVVSGYYGGKCVILPTDPARIFNSGTAFYTHPPKREWQGLTDEEAEDVWNRYCDEMGEASINDAPDIAQAIESALRSKNT